MARNEIDPIDVGALTLFPIAAGMELGVWSLSLNVFGGFDFAQPIFAAQGLEVSVAFLLALGSIAWIVGTNEFDGSAYDEWEKYSIAGTFGVLPIYAVVPAFRQLVEASDVVKLAVWLGIAIVAVYISYTE